MKSFIPILILSLFAAAAYCQPLYYCPNMFLYTQEEKDACMWEAINTCLYAWWDGCSDVWPYDIDGNIVACETACGECLNCVYFLGDPCCEYAVWPEYFSFCIDICVSHGGSSMNGF